VIAAIEQGFQGGGTGEVSGAKISQALLLAAADSRAGTPTAAVILFETGGVRLQDANLGHNAVADICSAVLDLRPLAPVIGVVAGTVGSFGGMSIAAGLCTRLIVTPQARIGLNGPAVIEQEGGVDEFDSSDHALIWAVDGGEQRASTALADDLVPDDADLLRAALVAAVSAGVTAPGQHRSQRLDVLASRLATLDPADHPTPADLRRLGVLPMYRRHRRRRPPRQPATTRAAVGPGSALSGGVTPGRSSSVLSATTGTPLSPWFDPAPVLSRPLVVGLTESLALARPCAT
jgi:malonate decarboxylase beta subunit